MNNKQNEELQSRREFFKKAAKAALPVVGAVVLASLPIHQTLASGCTGLCENDCFTTCYGRCNDGCKGCSGECSNSCVNVCKECSLGCTSSCGYNCSQGCKSSTNNNPGGW